MWCKLLISRCLWKLRRSCGPPSKSGAAVYRRLLYSVRKTVFVQSTSFVFPKAKTQYVQCYLIHFLIMLSEIIILLRLATSMIDLFMLDLVMFMIYLFQNLIIQLYNYSTS